MVRRVERENIWAKVEIKVLLNVELYKNTA